MRHYLLVLVLVGSSHACAFGKRQPLEPKIERCSHYDDGTAECLQADGKTFIHRQAIELDGYISTNSQDFDKYEKWAHRSCPKRD